MTLRILHVTQGYHPALGGTEKLVQRLSEEFVRQFDDEVTVFTTDCLSTEAFSRPELPRLAAGCETIAGVRVRRFPVRARLSRLLDRAQHLAYRCRAPGSQYLRVWHQGPIVPGLRRAIEEAPADVIAASSFPLLHMFTALEAARATGRPCVFYGGLHPDDDWGAGRPMIYDAIRRAAGYVAYTAYEADHVARKGAPVGRVRVIPLAADLEPFESCSDRAARAWLGVPEGVPVVGFIGQVAPHKGIDALLRAMPRIWRERPEARLLIAGARARYAAHIHDTLAGWPAHAREKVIVRHDFGEADKALLFRAVDVFAYPSGFESFGLAMVEAWAAGRPVVSCRRGAIPHVVESGRDGLLVEFGDDAQLAGAILALLDNPAWRRTLGDAGQRRVRHELTWDEVARRFRGALEAAVASRPTPPRRRRSRSDDSAARGNPDLEALLERLPGATRLEDFRRLLAAHGILEPDPRFIHMEIDVSNKCNLRCAMCYFSLDETFHADPVFLAPRSFRPIAEAVLPSAKALMLSIGSEPLTSPHFVPILGAASRHGVPELGFYTNGLLLKDVVIDAILDHGVTVVAVSVDGATKRTFEAIRRGADFDVLLRNLQALVRRRAACGRSLPRLRFAVVMMRSNVEELEDLVTLAWRVGVDELNFFHVVVYEGLDTEQESLVHHKALSNRCLERALARADELGVRVVHAPRLFSLDPAPKAPAAPYRRAASAASELKPFCPFPFFHVSVNSRGQVLACPFSHGEAHYGTLSEETSFERVWLGSRFTELRTRILTGNPPAMCRRCSFLASSYPDLAALFEPRASA